MTEDVLRTKRLEVVDDEGAVRIIAGAGGDGDALLGITDRDGNPRVSLSVGADGMASLFLNDDNGRPLVTLSIRPAGMGLQVVEPSNEAGGESVTRISLIVGSDNRGAALTINDANEEPRASVVVRPDGRPAFIAQDEDGNIVDGIGQ